MDLRIVEHLEQRNEVAEVLRRVRSRIDTPEKWAKGDMHTWRKGSMCVGLAFSIEKSSIGMAYPLFERVVGNPDLISLWNDASERTHADVMNAFSAAIALAESAGH